MWLIILIFSTICVRIRSWGCLHRQKQKKSLQRKNKKGQFGIPIGVVQNVLTVSTSLRSKWQNFFKFDGDFISEKYSPKFSTKQKTLVGCSYLCNPLCSNSAHLNMANDFSFPKFSTGFQSLAGFAELHPSPWHGNTLRR